MAQPKEATELNDAALEALRADVMAVPPDQQALGLVEAIQENTHYSRRGAAWHRETLAFKLGVIAGLVERLIPLLGRLAAERDELREERNSIAVAEANAMEMVGELEKVRDELQEQNAKLLAALEGFWAGVYASTVEGRREGANGCPHGNTPLYPAHGRWCDACFSRLEVAIAEAQEAQAHA